MENTESYKGKKIVLIGVMLCILLVILGVYTKYTYSIALVGAIWFIFIYMININKSCKFFLILMPFLPQFFSVSISDQLPLITVYRIVYIVFVIDELFIKNKIKILGESIRKDKFSIWIGIYLISVIIPTILSPSSSGIINLFSLIIEKILLYYIIRMNIEKEQDINTIIDIIMIIAFIMGVLGIIEFITSYNIFTILNISNRNDILDGANYIRMGNLRVSTSFGHSLGYGLYLVLMMPLTFRQIQVSRIQKNSKKLVFNVVNLVLINVNIFLTGSRSTLIILAIQIILIFSKLNYKKKLNVIIISIGMIIPIIFISLSSFGEKMPILSTIGENIKMMSDNFLGTNYIQDFGDNDNPFIYREYLINYALDRKGKEFLVGRGVGFLRDEPLVFNIPELNPWEPIVTKSIDNYYVLKFLELGMIGLFGNLIILGIFLINMLKFRKDYFSYVVFISTIGYSIHLTMVDELDTIKYLWIIFALFSRYRELKINNK